MDLILLLSNKIMIHWVHQTMPNVSLYFRKFIQSKMNAYNLFIKSRKICVVFDKTEIHFPKWNSDFRQNDNETFLWVQRRAKNVFALGSFFVIIVIFILKCEKLKFYIWILVAVWWRRQWWIWRTNPWQNIQKIKCMQSHACYWKYAVICSLRNGQHQRQCIVNVQIRLGLCKIVSMPTFEKAHTHHTRIASPFLVQMPPLAVIWWYGIVEELHVVLPVRFNSSFKYFTLMCFCCWWCMKLALPEP